MRMLLAIPCLALLLAARTAVAAGDDGFTAIFNGKDLTGWHGDPDLWSVEDGCIVGSTDNKKIQRNSFLATEKPYRNFVLKVKFNLRNHNSGVQVRSTQHPNFVVTGYQPDIAQSRYTGILYEEGGRGILADVDPKEVSKHFEREGWNQYVIACEGAHIRVELNGFTTVDYTEKSDKGAMSGVIAFQLHAGPKMSIQFKDIRIRELP